MIKNLAHVGFNPGDTVTNTLPKEVTKGVVSLEAVFSSLSSN